MNLMKHSCQLVRANHPLAVARHSAISIRACSSLLTIATDPKRPRVVILGAGWGGFRLAKDLNKDKYDVVVVSPRNHFLFTPLLPSTTVGTLEFRSVQEPVRTIKDVSYYQSRAMEVDFEKKFVRCCAVHTKHPKDVCKYDLFYDKLVIAVGSKSATFGVPGFASQEELTAEPEAAGSSEPCPPSQPMGSETGTDHHNVFFLKQLQHARAIRNRILECFERASNPLIEQSERERLLTFVVVGGGPTSVEFTSELYDFLQKDVAKWYKDMRKHVRVVIVEAGENLLGSFDSHLQSYVKRKFQSRQIELMTCSAVQRVCTESVLLARRFVDEDKPAGELRTEIETLPFGICVWATGNQCLEFTKSLRLSSVPTGPARGRILIDGYMRIVDESIPNHEDVFSLGDCAADKDNPLGLLAQVANQQGKYLAAYMNKDLDPAYKPFRYQFMGSMAQLGTWDAVLDGPPVGHKRPRLAGFTAFLAWRSAYWTYSVSITNKILIPMYWFKAYFFGRDISKF